MAAAVEKRDSPVNLRTLIPAGPVRCNHVGCIINNTFYIHGGIDKRLSKTPINKLHSLDLSISDPIWQEIRAPDCPGLSHHAGVVMENRYFVLIGGWDGRVRTTQVFVYDTREQKWTFPNTHGFPEGGGLSSHTTTLLQDGNILIIGREGSARLQRRYGNAYILSGSIQRGDFTYREQEISLSSRSGHTAHTLGSTLYILGGRADNLLELHSGYRSMSPPCRMFEKLVKFSKYFKPMTKPPCGRKQHVSVCGAGLVLVHGGETFDGRNREPVGEIYLISFKPHLEWFKLGVSGVGRAGHVCCNTEDRIILHGGMGAKGIVYGDVHELVVG